MDTNYYFLPPFLHVVLRVVNLLVTLLALADNSPTAILADLAFCLIQFCIATLAGALVGSGGFAFLAADLVIIAST